MIISVHLDMPYETIRRKYFEIQVVLEIDLRFLKFVDVITIANLHKQKEEDSTGLN